MGKKTGQKQASDSRISRRDFMGAAAAVAAFTVVPRHVLGGPRQIPPSEKLNIAGIGVGGRGAADVNGVGETENIIALCDVDEKHAAETFEKYPQARRYRDFRRMFDEMQNKIDAVVVGTTAGIDTIFIYWGGGGGCGYSAPEVVNVAAPATDDFYVLIADDFLSYPDPGAAITDRSGTAAFMTGDESDGEVYDDEGNPYAEIKAARARQLWAMYPDLPVYNGAKTNKNVGSFAGMTDIQGIDFYVAACAPHITRWGTHPPLRGAYDYLRNTRNNHMPLPTWQYAQGLHPGWNKDGLLGLVHVQPDPQEILVQAMSVVAAGGKGIMWFQVNQEEAAHSPARWDAVSDANWMIRGVRDYLREGDITGMAFTDGEAVVDMIRSGEALVVPVINLAVSRAPTDVACAGAFLSEATVPHWILADQTLSVTVTVPTDFGVAEIFEVTAGGVVDLSMSAVVDGRNIRLEAVQLSNAVPVRLFVLASHEGVRDCVMEAMGP